MIQITRVQGDVLVEDRTRSYTQMARSGLTLDSDGDYLIATTPASSADILTNGSLVKLGPSSYLRVQGGRTWWERHQAAWTRDAKLFLGRIWARLAPDPGDWDSGAGGGGVRG